MYKSKINGTSMRFITEDEARGIVKKYDESIRSNILDSFFIDRIKIKDISKIFDIPIVDTKVIIFMNSFDSVQQCIDNLAEM